MPSISTMPTATPAKPAERPLAQMPATLPASSNGTPAKQVQPQPPEKVRPVIYPEERAEICKGANALVERDIDVILGWMTEQQYQARMMAEVPGTEAGAWTFGKGPDAVYLLVDAEGNKVRCLNNLDNRPFDERWCKGLAQTILKFQWAGSITITELAEFVYGKKGMKPWTSPDGKVYQVGDLVQMSAGTINGSSMSISRTGRVESGQHSGCALKLANQMYRAAPRGTYPEWDAYLEKHSTRHDWKGGVPGPVLETILVTGLSEDRRVLMTVDNCKPRSTMDVLYTSEIFQKHREQPAKRQELSRMLAACGSFFWKRTKRQGYETHAEFMQMVQDHPKLIKCVEHLFAENADGTKQVGGKKTGGYLISNLGLSAGQAACLCYLMGCSASDGDAYRNGKPAPREKGLDWSRWDRAKDFWSLIGGHDGFKPVRDIMQQKLVHVGGDVVELSGGLGQASKLAVLAKAWAVWHTEGRQFTDLDVAEGGCLHLHYTAARTEQVGDKVVEHPASLVEDAADFGGVDVPRDDQADDAPPTASELEAAKEQALAARG